MNLSSANAGNSSAVVVLRLDGVDALHDTVTDRSVKMQQLNLRSRFKQSKQD